MIKFFRRIRQKLLNENKFSKYLLYATGEIMLVVLGILIALQINNWNENRKNDIKEFDYLKSYKTDLEANRDEFQRVIEKSNHTIVVADSLLKMATGRIDHIDLGDMGRLLVEASGYTNFLNQGGTVKEVIESGNLNVIKNAHIRTSIATWEANIDEIRRVEVGEIRNAGAYFTSYIKHIDMYKRYFDEPVFDAKMIERLFSDRAFLNSLGGRTHFPKTANTLYQQKLDNLEVLLKIIEQELSQG